jgi:gliding motility-associated-like protein
MSHSRIIAVWGSIVLSFFSVTQLFSQASFIPNKGQWEKDILYRANLSSGYIWISNDKIVFKFWDIHSSAELHRSQKDSNVINYYSFAIKFHGANFSEILETGTQSQEYYNYILGKDRNKWKSGLYGVNEILIKGAYEGVDIRIFEKDGNFSYNIESESVKALKSVQLEYLGLESIGLLKNQLNLNIGDFQFYEYMPEAYEYCKGVRNEISAKFTLNSITKMVGFKVLTDSISTESSIVIDPVLVFSTYSGSTSDNFGCTGTYDEFGNGFAGGTVFNYAGGTLPVTFGAFQEKFGGGEETNSQTGYGGARDVAILKFSSDGTRLLYCTYLGGKKNEQPHSMVAGSSGELYIMGSTKSSDFPVSFNAYSTTNSGDYDFFVFCLSPDGKSMINSTFLGGSGPDGVGANRENESIDNFPLLYNYADEFRGEIITDDTSVFVSGVTYSTNFPRSNNSGWFGGKEDACAFSFDKNLTTLRWSQLLGREGHEAFYGIAFGKNSDIYASGGVTSTNLPQSFSAFKNTYQGGLADGIAARFRKADGLLLSARYLGTNLYEQAYFVQTDNAGNPYLYGQTEGVFPILNSPFNQPGTGQFIVRLNPDLSAITLSTTFGANGNRPNISPSAFLVDQCERIFVSGWGGETNSSLIDEFTFAPKKHRNTGTTNNLTVTSDATQKKTDGSDFYVAVFAKNMNSLLYATYFGGISSTTKSAAEHVDGGTSRFDKKGIIYQSVCAGCGRNGLFPTTPGAYSRTNNSTNCNNALFKIDFENLNKVPTMRDTFIQVVALDPVQFTMKATDPDPFDPVTIEYTIVKAGGSQSGPRPQITVTPGIGSATINFNWITDCSSWSNDTLEIKVMVYDKGCPKSDTSYATFKVLVTEPPHVFPPSSVCVSFERNSGELQISWPSTSPSGNNDPKYFKYLLLKRIYRNVTTVLDTIRNVNGGSFTDKNVVNPALEDYCYYLDGVNVCDVIETALPFCTVRELNNPIEGVELIKATVVNDRYVFVHWEKSQEPDFKEYELYRYPRGGVPEKLPLLYLKDTFYVDSSLNVDLESYCYAIIVSDKCGHISRLSNPGCNVVIQGSATGRPDYYFDLNWMNYLGWAGGVSHWNLERQYNTYPWSFIENTGTDRVARDAKLDYDWGGYWYRVEAVEYSKSSGEPADTSQSNWIYLYQPPELWVPNAFTPEGNKINDVWGTVPVFVKNYNMRVYNRWGQKVWESDDKKRQWDGYVDGIKAADGVFAWYVTFDGWDDKVYRLTGTVTLLH